MKGYYEASMESAQFVAPHLAALGISPEAFLGHVAGAYLGMTSTGPGVAGVVPGGKHDGRMETAHGLFSSPAGALSASERSI